MGEDFSYVSYKLISEVFNATSSGETDLGVIPIENTLEGSVHLHVDWLVHEVDLPIRAEWVFPIDMNLIGYTSPEGKSDDSNPFGYIRKVLSHHVVPAQCSRFMKQYLSGAEFEQVSSTAEGVRIVSSLQDPSVAAIGTAIASTNYGVPMLQKKYRTTKTT